MIQSRVNRTSHRPTGLSVRYHGRRVFIGCLCPGLFVRTCVWNVWRGAMHRSWQTWTALLAWSTLSFCFRSSRSMLLTFFFTDEKVFSVASLDNRQNKVSGRLWELLKKKLSVFFSAATVWSATAWPPVNCVCVPQLSAQLIKHHALSSFSQEIHLSTTLFCTSSNTNFLSKSCPSLNTMLIVDKHCSDVCCDELPMPQ